jgi:hypothetical protein
LKNVIEQGIKNRIINGTENCRHIGKNRERRELIYLSLIFMVSFPFGALFYRLYILEPQQDHGKYSLGIVNRTWWRQKSCLYQKKIPEYGSEYASAPGMQH